MAKGGYRPGSGAKKGAHRITVEALRKAIEDKMDMKYEDMLAETQLKLFNDFISGTNTKEYIMFTENMSKRLLQDQSQDINITSDNLSREEIQKRIVNLTRKGSATSAELETGTDNQE